MKDKTKIYNEDCLEGMKRLPDNSVDAIVTDPPYEISFMSANWDASGIAYNVEMWGECLRVLKPGGHLLSFGGTRTYHRMACAIEDAGFEIRDMCEWVYQSGFPKSLNIGKKYDQLQGNEREVIGKRDVPDITGDAYGTMNDKQGGSYKYRTHTDTKGTSKWEGFGTAIKPAHEPICLARKPLSEKNIVENCIKHGTGALDIDGCRIPISQQDIDELEAKSSKNPTGKKAENIPFVEGVAQKAHEQGRFPANLCVTDDALNDGENVGYGNAKQPYNYKGKKYDVEGFIKDNSPQAPSNYADSGSKSRYFDIDVWGEKHGIIQVPKASKSERNKGCEGLNRKKAGVGALRDGGRKSEDRYNDHPTVKPIHLMAWLVRLVSKEGDTVLDPFMGSGTTAVASRMLNRNFIGFELNEDYIKIAEKRLQEALGLFA